MRQEISRLKEENSHLKSDLSALQDSVCILHVNLLTTYEKFLYIFIYRHFVFVGVLMQTTKSRLALEERLKTKDKELTLLAEVQVTGFILGFPFSSLLDDVYAYHGVYSA